MYPSNRIYYKDGEFIKDVQLLKEVDRLNKWIPRAEFLCSCGNKFTKDIKNVRLAIYPSCGCKALKRFKKLITKHGLADTPEYHTWIDIKGRCNNINNKAYYNYGGRGIQISQKWADSFEQFYQDMGSRPGKEYSIDRIDNNGNYESGNCRWAKRSVQNRNRRNNIYLVYKGETKVLKDWAKQFNMDRMTLKYRLTVKNMSVEEALETPKDIRFKYKN